MINNLCFSSNERQVSWSGKCIENEAEFKAFLTGPTRSRIFDEEQHTQYEADLRALTTTGMASDTITRLLSSEPEKESWEIGEALAECLLEEEQGVKFPWNSENSNSGDIILNYQEIYAWQIDEKVYKLYDPTQEEIAIVEGKK